jgi:hypothetical protein
MSGSAGRRRLRGAVGVVVASLVLVVMAACGDSGGAGDAGAAGGTSPSAGGDEQAQVLRFARCMRDNGVDMPDPGPGQSGLMTALQEVSGSHGQGGDPNFDTAYAACKSMLPEFSSGGHGQPNDETMLALAKCLRNEGLDVPDDLYSGGALHKIPREKLNAAMEKCREVAGFGEGH